MLKALRLLILVLTPLIFLGAWYILPEILDATNLRWLAGLVTILWGLEFYFFQRLTTVSSVEGLSSREHQLLVIQLQRIRKRVWWIGGIAFISAVTMWILAVLKLPISSPSYAAFAGFLLGVCLSYLILIPVWFNESQSFIDEVKRRDTLEKQRTNASKLLDSLKKDSKK